MKRSVWVLVGLIFVFLIAGLLSRQGGLVALALPLLVYLAVSIYHLPETPNLNVERQYSPERVVQGTPVEVHLKITNQGGSVEELSIADRLPSGMRLREGKTTALVRLPHGASTELHYTLEPLRGEYNRVQTLLTLSDPCGCFEQNAGYASQAQLSILPQTPHLDPIKIRPPQTRGFAGPIASRQGGAGIDFFGVREYQAGDPQRQINWKLSARKPQELFTNVHEQERVADVGILLDARLRLDVSLPEGQLFEHAVCATAALAESLLSDGNRVSLVIYGSGFDRVFPGYGKIQQEHILKTLARVRPGMNYALDNLSYLPTRIFPSGSQIVLVSPLHPEDIPVLLQMRARGYAVLVVSPDPISFEAAAYQDNSSQGYRLARAERQVMLQRARRAGIQVVDWQVQQPLNQALRQVLSVRQVFRPALGGQ